MGWFVQQMLFTHGLHQIISWMKWLYTLWFKWKWHNLSTFRNVVVCFCFFWSLSRVKNVAPRLIYPCLGDGDLEFHRTATSLIPAAAIHFHAKTQPREKVQLARGSDVCPVPLAEISSGFLWPEALSYEISGDLTKWKFHPCVENPLTLSWLVRRSSSSLKLQLL